MDNREIKFRAWQDDGMLVMPMSGNYSAARFFGFLYEDAHIMQYTGLKDKNGKEIYEADLLNNEWKVCFYTGMFVAVPISQEPTHDNSYQIQWIVATYDAVVSGNIYENHELLTHQK